MFTLIHAPRSRSTRILWLLEELNAPYDVRYVSIRRRDGSGVPDEANPHPHKQVPALLHERTLVTESIAVVQYLTDLHPDSPMGRPVGHAERGAYLSWLAYYAGVIEPTATAFLTGMTAGNPALEHGYRDMCIHVIDTLDRQGFLVGSSISAADLLLASALGWARAILPESAVVDAYVSKLCDRPAFRRAMEIDGKPDGFHD